MSGVAHALKGISVDSSVSKGAVLALKGYAHNAMVEAISNGKKHLVEMNPAHTGEMVN